MRISTYRIALWILLGVLGVVSISCMTPEERRKKQAALESVKKDSVKPAPNPYKMGQGTQIYDAQREALGNLDSAAIPPQPAMPRR